MRYLLLVVVVLAVSCSSQRYYIVRHAEKAIVTKDSLNFTAANPPLSEAGQVRAFVLRDELGKKNIENIFSTNYHRTVSTVMPLSDARNNMTIQYYNSSKDSLDSFIEKLKAIRKGNVLVVGHSNTVDDIVNKLTGEKNVAADLRDTEYDNMYIIRKRKDKMEFSQKKYGYPSNPEK